jgi:hypothetical protein
MIDSPTQGVRKYLAKNFAGSEPVLITKNITMNGTYNAVDDNAQGYSSVNVNVSFGVLLFRANDNSVQSDDTGPRRNLSITEGAKYSEYLSFSSSTGRFTALKNCSLVVVMYLYNNPDSSNIPRGGVFTNGYISPNDNVSASEYQGWICGEKGYLNKSGSFRFISLEQDDYFTLNVVATSGWPVVGAYGYLMPYLDKSLLTKYS